MEEQRSLVSEMTKQEREAQWNWVEPSVWTDKMLAALDKGVKGKSLIAVGSSLYLEPTGNYAGLLNEELFSGEPYAGEPHVRFGGRGVQ